MKGAEFTNNQASLERSVIDELDRRRKIGMPFNKAEIAKLFHCTQSNIANLRWKYCDNFMDELLSSSVTSSEHYTQWARDFNTFGSSFQRAAKYPKVLRRFMRLTIEDFYRRGELTFANVYKVTRRSKIKLREEFNRWEEETGEKAREARKWRDIMKNHAAKLNTNEVPKNSRDIIFAAFDSRRKMAVPFTVKDISQETGLSPGCISYHSRQYVAAIADELLSKNIDSDEAYFAWLRLFDTFQHSLRNTRKRSILLKLRFRLIINKIYQEGLPVSPSEVTRRTGGNFERIAKAIKDWETDTGNSAEKGKAWKAVTLQMAFSVVSPELHKMPLTFLESPEMGKAFNEQHIRMILGIRQPKLRDTAFFILAFADTNRSNDISFFSTFSKFISKLKIADIDEVKPDSFYQDFHEGKILDDISLATRGRFIQSYFRLVRRQKDYVRKLTHDQQEKLKPFMLAEIKDEHFWRYSTIHREVREDRKIRRKQVVAAVHEKFYLFRDIAERRYIQIKRMHAAYLDAIKHHKDTQCELPFNYSITDETILPSGNTRSVRHHFQLWNAATLRSKHRLVADEFYENISPYQKRIIEKNDDYYLTYEKSHLEKDKSVHDSYWFIDILLAKNVSNEIGDILSVPFKTDWDLATRWWHDRLLRDLGLVFLPTNALMRFSLIGRSAIQVMTKTGARMNEFLQIRLTPDHLRRVNLPKDRETIAFWAIPKGRKVEEPFYIDEQCMKTLHAWWAFQRDIGENIGPVKPIRQLSHKQEKATYLWQYQGRHLDHKNINSCMRFLLHGVEIRAPNNSSVSLSSHLLRHSFATELRALNTPIDIISLLMKQRDIAVTEYYSQPTPAKLIELQKKIFENRTDLSRAHVRSASHIKRQVEAVSDTIGALIPVVGGSCTVANPCPAKFACIGCAGNAPDPAKRKQVIEFKLAYSKMAEIAKAQNLPAERRKALEIISNCDDVLAEMDLIEQAENAASLPIILTPSEGNDEKSIE